MLLRLHQIDAAPSLPKPDDRLDEIDQRDETDEVETLRARVAELEAQLADNGIAVLVDAASVTAEPRAQPKSGNPRRMTPADDVATDVRPVVIDVKATVLDAGAPVAAPAPTEPGQWDRSDSGRAWASWRARNPDGYGGGGVI